MQDVTLSLLLAVVGFVGATLAGLAGVGGGIVVVPLLMTGPDWLGVPPFPMTTVAGLTSVQVLVASLLALAIHARKATFQSHIAVPMAIASAVGSGAGAVSTGWLPPDALEVVFAALCLVGGGMMLWPSGRDGEETAANAPDVSRTRAVVLAGSVGVLSGLVGAGGAFLLVPLMRTVLGMPLRVVVSTSLVTVAAAALSGTLGKAWTGQIAFASAAWLIPGTLIGAPLGAIWSHRIPTRTLRILLALLILFSGLRLGMAVFQKPPSEMARAAGFSTRRSAVMAWYCSTTPSAVPIRSTP
jgi:uncharacterized membrane protein YfcA